MAHAHGGHRGHAHTGEGDARRLRIALVLILLFMAAEVVTGIVASSLALLSDAGHMLTDAAALALALVAMRIARRPARGAMTYGFGRVEILSAQANGITLVLAGANRESLNVEGSFRHIVTDLYAFVATAIAGAIVLLTGFARADALASLIVAALMLIAGTRLVKASARIFLEAAPPEIDPQQVGRALAAHPGVVEVHDLHVWEVTSGFPALSAHVLVRAGSDCHELRRELQLELTERFGLRHTTLQVDHEAARQGPLRIELAGEPRR